MARKLKDVNIEIGARIKSERTAQKMTREDLAKLSGYSANFIQEVERGRSGLSSESIRSFAVALNLSADTLLFGRAPDSFEYVIQKLKAVPDEKMPHILKIIDEAIECTR